MVKDPIPENENEVLSNKGKKSKERTKNRKEIGIDFQKNLLDLVPFQTAESSFQDTNKELIRLLKPRFDTKFGKSVGKKMNINETYNINLDEYGTTVWRLIDGKLTVRQIGEHIKIQYDDTVEPLYPRLAEFLRILKTNDLIDFKIPQRKKRKRRLKTKSG
jgi:hypothetical protein